MSISQIDTNSSLRMRTKVRIHAKAYKAGLAVERRFKLLAYLRPL